MKNLPTRTKLITRLVKTRLSCVMFLLSKLVPTGVSSFNAARRCLQSLVSVGQSLLWVMGFLTSCNGDMQFLSGTNIVLMS